MVLSPPLHSELVTDRVDILRRYLSSPPLFLLQITAKLLLLHRRVSVARVTVTTVTVGGRVSGTGGGEWKEAV